MTNDQDDPNRPVDPFPVDFTAQPPVSPFPPLETPGDPPKDSASDWNDGADAHDLPTRENTLTALGRFAFPPQPPLDDEGEAARARRWTSQTMLAAVVVLLVFNAASLQNWARQQPPNWGVATVEQLADVWSARLSLLGADLPLQGLHEAWAGWREARFPGQAAAPPE